MIKKLFSNQLLRRAAIYTFSDGVSKAIGFILLPVVSYYLTTEDFGRVTNFNVLIQILVVLAGKTMISILPSVFYKRSKQEIRSYISNLIHIVSLTSLCLLLFIFIFSSYLESLFQLDLLYQSYTIICVFFTVISSINLLLWRLEDKPISFAVFNICRTILQVILVFLFVIYMDYGWEGKLYSIILTSLLFGIYNFSYLIRRGYFGFHLDKNYMKEAILFGLPMIPHGLSFWLKSGADKLLITGACGLSANGIYSVAISMGAVFSLIVGAFENAYTPYIMKKISGLDDLKEDAMEKKQMVLNIYKVAILLLAFSFVGVMVGIFLILFFFDQAFSEATLYIPFVIGGALFQSYYILVVNMIYYSKKTVILGSITFMISILQIIMAFFLIKPFGLYGAALATLIGSFIMFVSVWYYSNKVYPLPWFSPILYDINKRLFAWKKYIRF